MPMVIDLVLLDWSRATSVSESDLHCSTARGIYEEIERQLRDSQSHFRRKSVLGAVVGQGHGATIHMGRVDEIGVTELEALAPGPRGSVTPRVSDDGSTKLDPAAPVEVSANSSDPAVMEEADHVAGLGSWATRLPIHVAQQPSKRTGIPRINAFPKPPHRPISLAGSGFGFLQGIDVFRSLTGLIPGCAPACGIDQSQERKDSSVIWVAKPIDACGSVSAPGAVENNDGNTPFEAGLGGWPLCVPHAYAAFVPASVSVDHCVGPPFLFQRVAVEMDDAELAVIVAPKRSEGANSHGGPSSSCRLTPSTAASTIRPFPTQNRQCKMNDEAGKEMEDALWRAVRGRTVFVSAEVREVQKRTSELGVVAEGDASHEHPQSRPWPHWIEFVGSLPAKVARNQDSSQGKASVAEIVEPMSSEATAVKVIIALPNESLASRLYNALVQRRRIIPHAATLGQNVIAPRGVVYCELHIDARLNVVGQGGDGGAVIRRGICEACHVSAERVRVYAVREAGGGVGFGLRSDAAGTAADGATVRASASSAIDTGEDGIAKAGMTACVPPELVPQMQPIDPISSGGPAQVPQG